MVCCQVQWVQLGWEDQGPLEERTGSTFGLGSWWGSGAGRLLAGLLASQTRVDTGDTHMRTGVLLIYFSLLLALSPPFHPALSSPGTSDLATVAALNLEVPRGGQTAELTDGGG